ncbi:MAG: hypothetical protein K2I91_03960 [Muribaculaceae bacterium]|nr:hypothetical protein [Muribaculaceae bacterium]
MKKLFLIVALMASFAVARAEQYDELDLLGGWELVSCEGDYPFFTKPVYPFTDNDESLSDFKYLYFGVIYCHEDIPHDNHILPGISNPIEHDLDLLGNGLIYKSEDRWEDSDGGYNDSSDGAAVKNFFICGGNKLNLEVDNMDWSICLKFIITNLNDKELKLKSYDGKCTVVYKRISGANGVNGIAADNNDAPETYFNLNGIRRNAPEKGINIVRKGKTAKKIAVK